MLETLIWFLNFSLHNTCVYSCMNVTQDVRPCCSLILILPSYMPTGSKAYKKSFENGLLIPSIFCIYRLLYWVHKTQFTKHVMCAVSHLSNVCYFTLFSFLHVIKCLFVSNQNEGLKVLTSYFSSLTRLHFRTFSPLNTHT